MTKKGPIHHPLEKKIYTVVKQQLKKMNWNCTLLHVLSTLNLFNTEVFVSQTGSQEIEQTLGFEPQTSF